ncbi:hypothetical protein EQU24_18955 [Methylotuvimicrobium buryatense]|uniref:Uncharacterized protein n=1 Tax=Methylotuvimicrobium buryatense TaxID=95641 RepID=A0A4P9UTZ5_METBY|nr:hypothetical protein EQU24_18955 [Methylotuvimicrobium buryatense]
MCLLAIPFALEISALPKEAPGCPTKALPAWSWHRAYMDVFTASFDGTPVPNFDLRWVYFSGPNAYSRVSRCFLAPVYLFITAR